MSNEQKLLAACVDYRAKLDALERENAALREDKARLEYLSERWNPTSDLWDDQIGKWILCGDHDQMIKAIDAAMRIKP